MILKIGLLWACNRSGARVPPVPSTCQPPKPTSSIQPNCSGNVEGLRLELFGLTHLRRNLSLEILSFGTSLKPSECSFSLRALVGNLSSESAGRYVIRL
jgi:hypothetical protein